MSDDHIDVNAVVEQLMTRIAQLEFEVAVLKAARMSGLDLPETDMIPEDSDAPSGKPDVPNAGYM
jgi:transposase